MRQRLLIILLLIAAASIAIALVLIPRLTRPAVLTGYVEGEPIYLAASASGRIVRMAVQKGDRAAAGQVLFEVDPRQAGALKDQAEAQAAAAQSQAQDARKGQRPLELAVLDANIAAAEARAQDADAVLRRTRPLVKQGIYAPARLDDAKAAADAAQAQLRAARRQKDAAALGARTDQAQAAQKQADAAQAGLAAAAARLSDLSPQAPEAGRIEDVFYQAGEWAAANQPVLSLIPDARIRIRFFVPEADRALYSPGRTVRFACDRCAAGLSARITYVSPRPEFTPPVIYSREARDRLVYLVEAAPSARLNPGQPVDVTPLRAAP